MMFNPNPSELKRRREQEEERRAFLIADGAKVDTAVTISVALVVLMLVGFLLLGGLLSHAATGTAQASSGTSTTQSNANAQAAANAQATATAAAATPKEGPLIAPFSKGADAAKTTQSFSGPTKITVSGTGQSARKLFNDAFYIYTDQAGHTLASPQHTAFHDLCINGRSVDNYVQSIPAYNSSHTYTFTISALGGPLTFGVCDDRLNDNTGSFTITLG
jgi:hypothetical protein